MKTIDTLLNANAPKYSRIQSCHEGACDKGKICPYRRDRDRIVAVFGSAQAASDLATWRCPLWEAFNAKR